MNHDRSAERAAAAEKLAATRQARIAAGLKTLRINFADAVDEVTDVDTTSRAYVRDAHAELRAILDAAERSRPKDSE